MSLIFTAAFLHLLAVISPGPDFIMCARNSLIYSRRTGIFTAVGFGLGIAVHITYCIAGIAVVISQSILLFNIIKLLGAVYLIFIGIKSWRAKHTKLEVIIDKKLSDISPLQAVKIGFLTNVLNPKATLFFLSLFTLVIAPTTPGKILIIVGIWCVLQTILWFSFVATVLTIPHIRKTFERFQKFFNRFFGGILIILGIKVAISK